MSDAGSDPDWNAALDRAMSHPETNAIGRNDGVGDVDKILERVANSRWRRSAMDADTVADTRAKIAGAVAKGSRLSFSVPFGGYKSWRLRSHPSPDWAEVFAIRYICQYLNQIAELVPSGIGADFSYCGGVMDEVSNMPLVWQEKYLAYFRRVIDYFSTASVRLQLVDIADLYPSPRDLMRELQENVERISRTWFDPVNAENREKRLRSSSRNLVLVGGVRSLEREGGEALSPIIERSAIWCEAVDALAERRRFNKYSERIQLVFVRGPSLSVHVGSSETSSNHFWVGTGLLEEIKGRVRYRIASDTHLSRLSQSGSILSVDSSRHGVHLGIPGLRDCLASPVPKVGTAVVGRSS